MKYLSWMTVLFMVAAFAVYGAEKRIPQVWKAQGKVFKSYELYAFGFADEKDEYRFAFQIKNLHKFMEGKNAVLVCCFNTDNNAKTGRFQQGWDMEINILLPRRAVAATIWENGKIKTSYSFREKEFSIVQKDDVLYLTLKKVVFLKNVAFSKQFQFFEEHVSDGKAAGGSLEKGISIVNAASGKLSSFIIPEPAELAAAAADAEE